MTMDILIFLNLGFIVFKSSVHCQLLTYNIAHMAQLKSSSVLTYGMFHYDTTNVIDGNPATSPDHCNCCWSSRDEPDPWLEVILPRHEYLVDIVLHGRTDHTDEPRKLSGLNVQADGIAIPDKWIFVNSTHNFVSIRLQNRPVKVVRIDRPKMHEFTGRWFLIICEVFINIQVVELFQQLRKTSKTTQTGLFSNNSDYGSSKAIDGLTNYTLDACKCCSVTADADPPISWWHIDLKKKYTAYGLEIFGREKINKDDNKQIQNAKIYASNSSMEDSIDTGYLLFVVPTIHDTTHFIKHLQRPVIAQYFIVRINNTQLTLCEIIVYGKGYCNVGSFGLSCTSKCHCEDKMSCHPWTGYCQTPRCMPGWEGPSCDKEAIYQQLTDFKLYFSNNTGQKSYHLVENTTRRIDGNEHVLTFSNKLTRYIKIQRPGVLTSCEVLVTERECEVGTFGEECSQICHCADERACDKRNGYCQSDACKVGWIGKSCNKECPKNTFGDKCSERCFCAYGTCTNDYGICENGCQDGYTGFHCNQVEEMNNQTNQGEKEKNATALVAGVVSGSIIVLILSALIVVVLIIRKRKRENNKSHYSTPKSRAAQDDTDYDTLDVLNDNQGQRSTVYENEVVSSM